MEGDSERDESMVGRRSRKELDRDTPRNSSSASFTHSRGSRNRSCSSYSIALTSSYFSFRALGLKPRYSFLAKTTSYIIAMMRRNLKPRLSCVPKLHQSLSYTSRTLDGCCFACTFPPYIQGGYGQWSAGGRHRWWVPGSLGTAAPPTMAVGCPGCTGGRRSDNSGRTPPRRWPTLPQSTPDACGGPRRYLGRYRWLFRVHSSFGPHGAVGVQPLQQRAALTPLTRARQ